MQAAGGAAIAADDDGSTDGDTSIEGRASGPARYRRLLFSVALGAYALDLGTKIWALEELRGQPDIDVVGELLKLHFTSNPGAAFSTGTGFTPVITCVAIVATLVILFFSRRVGSTGWAVGLGFLLAGVTGNLTDRMVREPGPFRGEVVDMFMLPNWPVFNVADICINIAAAIIVIQAFRGVHLDGTRESDESEELTDPDEDGAQDAQDAQDSVGEEGRP